MVTQPWASFLWEGVSLIKFGRWQWTFSRSFQRTSLFACLEMTVVRDEFPTRVDPRYQWANGFLMVFGWWRVISEIWRTILLRLGFGPVSAEIFFIPTPAVSFLLRSCLWCSLSTEPVCSRPNFKTKIFSGRRPFLDQFLQWHSFLPCWVVEKDR